MFRKSKINWEKLFEQSIQVILTKYGLTQGSLELDDTERERSKNARLIHHLGKHKDKKSGGYFLGQSMVFLLLVTDKVSIPVGFEFYKMDPQLKAWQQQDAKLKKQGVKKKDRPAEPGRNPQYPTRGSRAIPWGTGNQPDKEQPKNSHRGSRNRRGPIFCYPKCKQGYFSRAWG